MIIDLIHNFVDGMKFNYVNSIVIVMSIVARRLFTTD